MGGAFCALVTHLPMALRREVGAIKAARKRPFVALLSAELADR
jgi:hypothetical protein